MSTRLLPLVWCALALCAPAAAQEIVVTADREALAANGPASAARLEGEDLAFIAAQAPSEALNRLPGVSIQRNNGVENLMAIRSPVLTGGQSAGSFLVLDNGVPIRAPGFANVNQIWETSLDFADSVTVVRGPGSSLYGSNAVHGVVDVRTQSGILDRTACVRDAASVSADTLGRSEATFTARRGVRTHNASQCALPLDPEGISEPLGLGGPGSLLGLAVSKDAGWRSQSGLDRQALTFGFGLGAPQLGREIELRLVAQNLNQESAGFIEGQNAYRNRALARTNPAPEAYRDARLVRGQVALNWRTEGGTELRLIPFARFIETDLNLFFFPSRAQEVTRQRGGGVLASAAFDVSPGLGVVLGVDVDRSRGELIEFQARPTVGTFTQGLHYDYAVDMTAAGAYGQLDWALAENWTLTAGLRGEHVRYDYDNRAPTGDVGRFRRPADRRDTFEGLAPRLGLTRAFEGGRLWLNLARGARPPQITDLYSLQTRQNPGEQGLETLNSVELGWRSSFDWGELEIVAYAMDKNDTSFRGADGFTVTGGRTRHQGLEVSGDWAVTPALTLSGWASLSEQTYRFDSPADGIRRDARIDTAPERLANLTLTWRPTERLRAELEWSHTGAYFTDAANSRVYPGHDLFALRSAWQVNQAVELYAALRNVTNTDYADRADFAFGANRYFPGAPPGLTFGVRYLAGS